MTKCNKNCFFSLFLSVVNCILVNTWSTLSPKYPSISVILPTFTFIDIENEDTAKVIEIIMLLSLPLVAFFCLFFYFQEPWAVVEVHER